MRKKNGAGKPKSDNNPRNNSNNKRRKPKNHGGSRRQQPRRKPKPKSTLDPALLIQPAEEVKIKKYSPQFKFEHMYIHEGIKKNLKRIGFEYPTEIQDKTYEKLTEGANLIGIADTGTGKTGAFLLPIIQRLVAHREHRFQTLVVLPTRELALQVLEEFKKLSRGLGLKASCHIGGTNINTDMKVLKGFNHLVIGTPGRLLDLSRRKSLKLRQFEVLILDEFDRMLDMGFIHDIRSIVTEMQDRRQTLLFSATRDPKQKSLIDEIVHDPFTVQVSSGNTSSKNVDQNIVKLDKGQNKYDELLNMLQGTDYKRVILFVETKRLADRISRKLNKSGVRSDQIHGNKSQNYRVQALSRFKRGKIKVLVATDVAARGIDVEDVTHVINYQIPRDYDTYIHRIGRTGRAGKKGKALTFVEA